MRNFIGTDHFEHGGGQHRSFGCFKVQLSRSLAGANEYTPFRRIGITRLRPVPHPRTGSNYREDYRPLIPPLPSAGTG